MAGLFTLCLFVIFTGNICLFSRKKIEEVIALSFCWLILFLYILGMLKRLNYIGVILLIVNIFLLGLYICRNGFKKFISDIRISFMTFGGMVFLCLTVLICCFGYGRRVLSFDEFNFWATAVKSLWHHNGFASAVEVWSVWEYPQGMTLLEWFGSYITGQYSEWAFYMIRLLFDFSLLMPVFKNFNMPRKFAPVAAVLLFMIPSMINFTSYATLSVDGDLAFLFGFLLYSILDRSEINCFYYLRIILCSSIIMLTKSFSIVFVGYGWLLFAGIFIYEKKNIILLKQSLKHHWNILYILLSIIVPLFVLKSWSWFLALTGSSTAKVTTKATDFVTALLEGTWKWTGYEQDIIAGFFKCFFTIPISASPQKNIFFDGLLTPCGLTIGIVLIILFGMKKRKIAKEMGYLLLCFWLFIVVTYSLVFIIAHCTIFVGEIEKYADPSQLYISLGRYCAPIYLGGFSAVLLYGFDNIKEFKIKNILKNKVMAVCCLFFILLGTNYYALKQSLWTAFPPTSTIKNADEKLAKISQDIAWTEYLEPEHKKIYFLGSKNIDPMGLYNLVPIIVQIPSYFYPIYGIGDLQSYLYEHEFDYIYFDNDDIPQALLDSCNQMLPEGETMEIGNLYKIDMSKIRFRLNRINMN